LAEVDPEEEMAALDAWKKTLDSLPY